MVEKQSGDGLDIEGMKRVVEEQRGEERNKERQLLRRIFGKDTQVRNLNLVELLHLGNVLMDHGVMSIGNLNERGRFYEVLQENGYNWRKEFEDLLVIDYREALYMDYLVRLTEISEKFGIGK